MGYRKFILTDKAGSGETSDYFLCHLHDDGSFSIALTLGSSDKASRADWVDKIDVSDFLVVEEFLTKSLLTAFEVSIPYSALAGSSGTLDLQISIKGKAQSTMQIVRKDSNSIWEASIRSPKIGEIRSHRSSCQVEDLKNSMDGKTMAMKQLLDGLLNNFGLVESFYFDEDGKLDVSKFPAESRTALNSYLSRWSSS